MTIAIGSRLGPYEVLSALGAGGMGEVWRARDGKLNREVAIKVLPQRLASDADALARFEREAKAVAALSHPNILSPPGTIATGWAMKFSLSRDDRHIAYLQTQREGDVWLMNLHEQKPERKP